MRIPASCIGNTYKCCDAIDEAVRIGLFESRKEGNVYIQINKPARIISIEDNATGIPAAQAEHVLKNVAKSEKDRSKDKGFRGIGRIGGLAYCDKLVFETSVKGEVVKSIMTWECEKTKSHPR